MALLEQLQNYQTEIMAFSISLLVTFGITFLFHPAIIVYHHEALEHTTTVLQDSKCTGNDNGNKTSKNKNEEETEVPDVLLSLVIPSYNEEDRLPIMLDEAYEYLRQAACPALQTLQRAYHNANPKKKIPSVLVEWLVSNDGSSDRTCQVFEEYVSKLKTDNNAFLWKLASLPFNAGKGAAVSVGMTESTGYYRLMVDADGATTFGAGLEAVTNELLLHSKSNNDSGSSKTIIFGSRAGEGAKRSAIRTLLMHSFLWLRACVVGTPKTLHDTQCGFKLFDRPSAMKLFSNLHLRRWAFDIELVYVAMALGMTIKEVKVPWHEVDGSKLNTGFLALVWVSIGMLRDMICVRACYVLGIWKIRQVPIIEKSS